MGYVDNQIAIAQKQIGDAVAGKGLQKAIRALQEKSRITDSLKPLPNRGAITAKRKTAKRAVGASSPMNETSRANYDEALVYSSSGLFVFRYAQPKTINFSSPAGQIVVNFLQQTETA